MSLTEQEIINSQAFKVLNHMIDQKVDYITKVLPWIKDEVNRLYDPNYGDYKGYITYRTYEEGQVNKEETQVDLPVSLHQLKNISEYIQEVIQLEKEIGDLQRQKLRLLNDYDFTHGDDTEQKAVFG